MSENTVLELNNTINMDDIPFSDENIFSEDFINSIVEENSIENIIPSYVLDKLNDYC